MYSQQRQLLRSEWLLPMIVPTNYTNDLMLHYVIYHAMLLTLTAFYIVSIKLYYIVLQLTLIYYVSQCKKAFAVKEK